MRELAVPHYSGALITGFAAHVLAVVLDRGEIEKRLRASNVNELHCEATMLAIEAIELAASDWQRDIRKREKATSQPDFRTRLPHAEARLDQAPSSSGMSATQAASELNLTSRQVRSLAATAQLDASKPGRDWVIDPDSVAAYKERNAKPEP